MGPVKVSVIIPVYNAAPYLRQCLDSVIGQDLKELEIWCINDGSTDDSLQVLLEYAAKDKRIQVIDKENGGQGMARNIAIKRATGEYLGFVDSDDWIAPNMYQELYSHAKQFSTDVTICELKLFDPDTGTISRPPWTKIPFDESFDNRSFHWSDVGDKILLTSSGPVNKIYKREFINEIHAQFAEGVNFEDILFVFTVIFNAKKINYIRKPYYTYRFYRTGSVSANKGRKQFGIFTVMNLLQKTIEGINGFEFLKLKFYDYKFNKYLFHLAEVNRAHKAEFVKSIRVEYNSLPNDVKNYLNENNFLLTVTLKAGWVAHTIFNYAFRFLYLVLTSTKAGALIKWIKKRLIHGK
jgi:glycosyltransferase involved in cell wall biosynthesis